MSTTLKIQLRITAGIVVSTAAFHNMKLYIQENLKSEK